MRIGMYDPYLDTVSGGEKYMLSIAAYLAKRNDVSIFWDKTQEKEIREKVKEKFAIDLSAIKFTDNIFASNISFLSRLKKSRQYDKIIYLSDGSIPFVATEMYIHFQFPVQWVNGKNPKVQLKLKRVKKIFCNSSFTKSYIDKTFGVKSVVSYPPIAIKAEMKIKKENHILHVGRFGINKEGDNYKKQDVMIDLFKKMINEGLKDWEFILVIGVRKDDEEKFEALQKTVKGYPIEILKNPTNAILWENFAKAKIYWHASGFGEDLQKYPERAEHFGMSTVEAMGAGLVPVVINAGGQPEIVENEKNGFLWNTKEECIKFTKKLIGDAALREKMSEEAKKRAKDFSPEKFNETLKKIIA